MEMVEALTETPRRRTKVLAGIGTLKHQETVVYLP